MKALLGKSPDSLFATRTLTGHLLRGAAAGALLYAAISQQAAHPVWSLVAGIGALVAMRGCPACRTIGLLETIQNKLRGPGLVEDVDPARARSSCMQRDISPP